MIIGVSEFLDGEGWTPAKKFVVLQVATEIRISLFGFVAPRSPAQNISWTIDSLRMLSCYHPLCTGAGCITTQKLADSPYLSSLRGHDMTEVTATDDSSWETLVDPADTMEKRIWHKLDLYILPVVAMFYFLSFLVSLIRIGA